MAEHLPKHSPGKAVTYTVGAGGVVGKQLVKMSADDTVVTATATGDVVVGVAAFDAAAAAKVTVLKGGIHELTAVGAIAAGARIQAAAGGGVATWAGANVQDIIGHCERGSAGGASTGRYQLYR